jgi:hypothetical protein
MINDKCSTLSLIVILTWIFVWGCVSTPAFKPSEELPPEEQPTVSAPQESPSPNASHTSDIEPMEETWVEGPLEEEDDTGLQADDTAPTRREPAEAEPALTEKREASHSEASLQDTKKAHFEASLKNIEIGTLEMNREKLPNVLKVLSAMTGVNFMVEKDIFPEKEGEEIDQENELLDIEMTFYLKDISLLTLIEILCEQYGLAYRIYDDYVRIMDKRDNFLLSLDEGSAKADDITVSQGMIKRLDLKGMPLFKALRVLSARTGVNVVCKDDSDIKFKKVSLVLRDIPVMAALEVICKKYDLWYKVDEGDNYVYLMDAKDFGDQAPVDYVVRSRVFNLKYASAPQVADSIACVMGNRVEYTLPRNLRSYEHLKLPDVESEEGEIEEATKIEESVAMDIESPEVGEFVTSLTAEKIEALIGKKLDLMLTSEDIRLINKKFGFALMTIFLRNNAVVACSTDDRVLNEIATLIDKLDTPTPQVLIECKVLSVGLNDDFSSFFQITDLKYKAQGEYLKREEEELRFSDTTSQSYHVSPFGKGGVYALYDFVDDRWDLNVEMELLKKDGIINVVSTSMLVAAQNTEGEIKSGLENVPFFKDMDVVKPVVEEDTIIPGYATPTYERAELIGTTLRITPQINRDKSVTLRIFIDKSDIAEGAATIQYPVFDSEGYMTKLETTDVDVKNTNNMNTIIDVPENHTLILGGFVDETDHVEEDKVPFLGDMPVLGFFFKDHATTKERKETVFLLTPHIMMTPGEVGGVSAEAMKGMQHPLVKEGKKDLFEFDEELKSLRKTE